MCPTPLCFFGWKGIDPQSHGDPSRVEAVIPAKGNNFILNVPGFGMGSLVVQCPHAFGRIVYVTWSLVSVPSIRTDKGNGLPSERWLSFGFPTILPLSLSCPRIGVYSENLDRVRIPWWQRVWPEILSSWPVTRSSTGVFFSIWIPCLKNKKKISTLLHGQK